LIAISELEKILLGALVAALSAYIQLVWRANREAFEKRIDEFCALIFEAADLGAEYWATEKPQRKASDGARALLLSQLRIMESRIDGLQQKIELFRLLVRRQIRLGDHDALVGLMAEFFDALSGGNFGAEVRKADIARARLVYTTATDVVAHLRELSPTPNLYLLLFALLGVAGLVYFIYGKPMYTSQILTYAE